MNSLKKICTLFIVGSFLVTTNTGLSIENVSARNIGQLSNFLVTRSGNNTGSLKKLNNSNTVINLTETNTGKKVYVHTIDSNTGVDKGQSSLWTGTRLSYSDRSTAGNYYHLRLSHALAGNNFYVYGSWSPDSY